MNKPALVFLAPVDFDLDVLDEYMDVFDIGNSVDARYMVCNPLGPMLDRNFLAKYIHLEVIATPSTGTDHIDLAVCKERNIRVISLLDNRKELEKISASAEFTFKLLLDAMRMRKPYFELQGKKVGIVGYGRIGRRMEKWLKAFGATPVLYDPNIPKGMSRLDRIFKYADAVVVSCTLNEETRNMITEDLLRSMKHEAVLVNTARGEIIDEDALVRVMRKRQDLRVALDVVSGERSGSTNAELLRSLGAIVTPHIAGNTFESRTKAAKIILDLLKGIAYE